MSKRMRMPMMLALSCLMPFACICPPPKDPVVREFLKFFDKPTRERLERFRQYSLADQYKIFRYGNHCIEPPLMGLAVPIAEKGAAAVPFLVEQLSAEVDDITIKDILLIFATMAITGSYDVKADKSLMTTLASKVSGMQDKDRQAVCLKELQDIRESR